MNNSEIIVAQSLIDSLSVGDKKCLKEIYGDKWNDILEPNVFGKKFKEAVLNNKLKGVKHIGIRSTGRCDEYEKI
ncbi:hypothetical protein [Methylomicrobium album]|uniref:hypothetical protein n=1 Tax=Methylomicrobium album TaxID=39775 RepID=UPI0002624010|nr:hypothetical protein [Methylomicrobium album]